VLLFNPVVLQEVCDYLQGLCLLDHPPSAALLGALLVHLATPGSTSTNSGISMEGVEVDSQQQGAGSWALGSGSADGGLVLERFTSQQLVELVSRGRALCDDCCEACSDLDKEKVCLLSGGVYPLCHEGLTALSLQGMHAWA
jgi:hypothetical protein